MESEIRTICFDQELQIEAYRFQGVQQKFPNHFHEYYVVGFIEKGKRSLLCNERSYIITPGDLLVFNPRDTHSCQQISEEALDYRCLNINPDIMKRAAFEIFGVETLPLFSQNVLFHSDLAHPLRELHQMITEKERDFQKEEVFLFLLEQLISEASDTKPNLALAEPSVEIKAVCDYLNQNYAETITLEKLSAVTGLSKYHMLHCFTRQKGISPYCYLETVRISKAKQFLEQGENPIDVAFLTGFHDQSHFSNYFKKLIGLTPKQYSLIFKDKRPDESTRTAWPEQNDFKRSE